MEEFNVKKRGKEGSHNTISNFRSREVREGYKDGSKEPVGEWLNEMV